MKSLECISIKGKDLWAHLNKIISFAIIVELQHSTFSILITTGCPKFEGFAYQVAKFSINVVCHNTKKKKKPYNIVMYTFGP